MSSDDEDLESGSSSSRGVFDIANAILFGNIDNDGRLADDIFDDECKKHLGSLQPHLGSLFSYQELIGDAKDVLSDDSEANSDDEGEIKVLKAEIKDDNDYTDKNKDAVDYSDINEFIEDEPEKILDQMDLLVRDRLKRMNNEDDDYDANDSAVKSGEGFSKDKDGFTIPKPLSRPSTGISKDSVEGSKESADKKKLDTPLAAMLPSKYENMDVTELFPEFRHNQVLRFSRLFGPGKSSSLPQLWKNVKNKRKNRHIFENKVFIIKTASKTPTEKEWKFNVCSPSEINPNMIETDDEIRMLQSDYADDASNKKHLSDDEQNMGVADWRYGPAKIWYDMLKVPENGDGFNYGFKLKEDTENGDDDGEDLVSKLDKPFNDPDEAFHLVTQLQWENDIIWNADEIRQKILAKLNDKHLASGWLPSGMNRTATSFTQQIRSTTTSKPNLPPPSMKKSDKKHAESNREPKRDQHLWYSIFPIENEELIYNLWEKEIIWDAENMDSIPPPKVLTLDRNDENIILEVPMDEDPNEVKSTAPTKEKKEGIRKSRLLLGKAGVIAEPEVISPPSPPSNEKDPYNISNDEYYSQKTTTDAALKTNPGGNLIQHSIPALELRQPFFPTFLNYQRLRAFHRPSLKRYSHGGIADTLPHGVNPLVKHIKRKAKQREQERIASGGGEMFFMRTPEDLTGKDGDLILTEYSEEHPPLVMQPGMATKIKNFYKRKPGKDSGAPNYKYGETVYCHTSPFLGILQPGQSQQALENNLFRAPIYEHKLPDTDFLVIRTRDNYFIREVETIYTVGQELPLYEVPGPNSKKANNFIRDFLQVFIYRLFWKSTDNPRRIKMEDIKKAFPAHSESSIRKRLKQCADFKRTGMDSNWWVLKSDFRLPSEDEIRAMVSPEACCAYYSMLAAEQRLKDAGYGEKSMFAPDDAEDEDLQVKMDDEVKTAPWNTSRAFISATKGKCLLQLTGIADPTGCGEGFSYVRIPNKPTQSKEEAQKEPLPKKTVTGTDADLRRLPLNAAKNLLRKFGVPDEEIKKLSRWEVIDVVRTLSTKQAKQQGDEAGDDDAMSKFARGNRFSIAEHQERYKEDCQRIFDLQNRVLASTEDLSTDEDESEEEEDSEIEELGKNIESMLANKKTMNQISQDKEEEERRELKKLLFESVPGNEAAKKNKPGESGGKLDENDYNFSLGSSSGRILKIYRTYTNSDGKDFVRIETVRKAPVIDTYVRIRSTKDETFIRQFASTLDDQQKEEKRKEKRRIQEQMRRMKRNQEREKLANSFRNQLGLPSTSSFGPISLNTSVNEPTSFTKELKLKKIKKEKETNLKLKCGACGSVGHMRTNRACPLYKSEPGQLAFEGIDTEENSLVSEDNLVKVDETKVVLSKSVFKHLDEQEQQKSKALKLKIPKEVLTMKRKRRVATTDNCDYLQKPDYKSANRRRTDPLVVLSDIFEEVVNEMRALPGSEVFHAPVNAKTVPDYYNIIANPMDLQTIKQNIREKRYKNRDGFLCDVSLIVKNSELYNGINSLFSTIAKQMMELCVHKIQQKEDDIIKLEKLINPLLDSDQVAFSYILSQIVEQLKAIPESWPFHKPVNKKAVKNYYEVIKNPMDFETLENNVQNHRYKSREEFLYDVELIFQNSVQFNGPDSQFTKKALEIVETARATIEDFEKKLDNCELNLVNPEKLGLVDYLDDESNFEMDEEDGPPRKIRHLDDENSNDYGEIEDHKPQDDQKDIVADDLQMTPQNSGDESDGEAQPEQPSEQVPWNVLNYPPEPMMANEDDNFDENYDPSEFLLNSSFAQQSNILQQQQQQQNIASQGVEQEHVDVSQDLDVSDSDEEPADDDDDGLWF